MNSPVRPREESQQLHEHDSQVGFPPTPILPVLLAPALALALAARRPVLEPVGQLGGAVFPVRVHGGGEMGRRRRKKNSKGRKERWGEKEKKDVKGIIMVDW